MIYGMYVGGSLWILLGHGIMEYTVSLFCLRASHSEIDCKVTRDSDQETLVHQSRINE